jgi:hypothetical protein
VQSAAVEAFSCESEELQFEPVMLAAAILKVGDKAE